MNVPARGGVKRTVSESRGAIAGSRLAPAPLQPGTPSGKLSSSMPCQCTAAASCDRFTIVIATGSSFSSTSVGPGKRGAPSPSAYAKPSTVPYAPGREWIVSRSGR
jgi:hypothetical protein